MKVRIHANFDRVLCVSVTIHPDLHGKRKMCDSETSFLYLLTFAYRRRTVSSGVELGAGVRRCRVGVRVSEGDVVCRQAFGGHSEFTADAEGDVLNDPEEQRTADVHVKELPLPRELHSVV